MTEIKLEKRYPRSRTEDITDAFMRGYEQGYKAKEYDRESDCGGCKFEYSRIVERCEGCCRNYADGYVALQTEPNCSEIPNNCETCKWGEWYRKGYDITMMSDECGGCCSWNNKWTPKEPQTELIAQIHELYAEMEKLLRKSSAEIVGAIREQMEKEKSDA